MAAISSWAANGLVLESLVTRAPIGIGVRDLQLRCTWGNDTMELQDGIPREQRLGRRLAGVLPGGASQGEAEACDREMRQVPNTGAPVVHDPCPAWRSAVLPRCTSG